jgi:hypothetical protein
MDLEALLILLAIVFVAGGRSATGLNQLYPRLGVIGCGNKDN